MTMKEAVLAAIKELVLPELQTLKQEHGELKATLVLTNKRLDDLNLHLADQSRRIDDTNKRIDTIHVDIIGRIDAVHTDLISRNDETNRSIARLYEVIVRRDEHADLVGRVRILEQEVAELKRRVAA
ncbi:MAG: hypothetical protein FJ134_13115 [Deltaproteobacteria bacterium]|nr:hypothetical protein [Deltaproteobacteria bacterium]